MNALIIIITAALASIAVTRVRALPTWCYKLQAFKMKPLNCMTCLAFWIGLLIALFFFPYICIVIGLASAGAAVAIVQLCKI